ncbi:uncharacterized protein QC763_207450 [Podospora pseudopauciseta]|uniref:Oxidoreductase AflY n=1 Tax=Podospora pseudopauciseta TaxID=2093780 RepID=A0ABR0HQ04_9PEZI|nr:hypothetical protein QC763_207450 [Podospora pseudopauciseta]
MAFPRERCIPKEISPYNIQLSPEDTPGNTHVKVLTQESADKVSELLMVNHVRYHTLFDAVGFHNHTVHHLLTLWALGATPSEVQAMYDLNKPYQALIQYHPASVAAVKLKEPAFFKQCIGNLDYYQDYVRFFQDEIAVRGVPAVVNEYLFKGDELSDDIFARMHSGFLHPMIHLGCGLEFSQPCLVAEALAAGCVHDEWPEWFIFPVEEYLKSNPDVPSKSLLEIVTSLQSDPVIANAVTPDDPLNKISDGLLKKVAKELVPYLASYQVDATPEDLQQKTTAMIHTCAYILGAAQHPGKVEAIDFVMLHMSTLGIFYPTFMAQDWISNENKKRMLQWKAWGDAVMYAGCGCPKLYPERVTGYTPKRPQDGWPELCHRANVYGDDGHISKVIRAMLNTQELPEPVEGFPLAKKDFLKIAHLALDSVERMLEPGQYKVPDKIKKTVAEEMRQDEEIVRVMVRWVRWCGVEGSWDNFPDLVEKSRGEEAVVGDATIAAT